MSISRVTTLKQWSAPGSVGIPGGASRGVRPQLLVQGRQRHMSVATGLGERINEVTSSPAWKWTGTVLGVADAWLPGRRRLAGARGHDHGPDQSRRQGGASRRSHRGRTARRSSTHGPVRPCTFRVPTPLRPWPRPEGTVSPPGQAQGLVAHRQVPTPTAPVGSRAGSRRPTCWETVAWRHRECVPRTAWQGWGNHDVLFSPRARPRSGRKR